MPTWPSIVALRRHVHTPARSVEAPHRVYAAQAVPEPPKTEIETLRLHQANERTMLAWIRTGIALMAFGFAIARFGIFLRQVASVGQPHIQVQSGIGSAWVGAMLVALGMLASLGATTRYAQIRAAIRRSDVGAPSAGVVYAFGATATLVGLVMTVLLVRALGD
jgi:putative membrane protein